MKLSEVFFTLCALLYLSSCAMNAGTLPIDSFGNTWAPKIAFLNQETDKQPCQLDASVDLLRLNEAERTHIRAEWKANKSGQKNAFFSQAVTKLNDVALAMAEKASAEKTNLRQIAKEVLRKIEASPEISPEGAYAFEDGNQIGFCFGRALAVHYLLLKAGVSQSNLSKIFAVGELMVGYQMWNFHMAVAIKEGDTTLVVDPLYKEPLALEAWIDEVTKYDVKYPYPRTRFYITDPRKFMPTRGMYAIEHLREPELITYFTQMSAFLDGLSSS